MPEHRLDEVEHELYRLDPAEFTERRNRRAAEARERGDKRLAAEIKKLRRPVNAAWAVNLLRDRRPERVDTLMALGDELRSAQRELRGDELRRLARRRSGLIGELTREAGQLAAAAGHPLAEQARRQVEQTLNAALSDPDSARQVRRGTLIRPLEYSGFGLDELAVAAATGTKRRPPGRAGAAKRQGPPGRDGRRQEERDLRGQRQEDELAGARGELARTGSDLERAGDELERARSDQQAAEQRRSRLRDELAQAEREVRDRGDEVARARRRRERAQREHGSAEQRVRRLEKRIPD